jgi:ribosomal protein L11 methyltransferase
MRTWPAIDVHRLSEPDLLQASLNDLDVVAIDERSVDSWRVFFQTAEARDRAAGALPPEFPDFVFEPVDVADEDWAARSQAELRAVRVGDIVVAPPWDIPASNASTRMRPAKLVIVIQPSMGFGTGHHATTRLCLAALQQFNVKGSTVIDVGTGSGVLAIAAHRLGAARVIAIDDDPDAIAAAQENVDLNKATVDLRVANLRHIALSRFDLVLANLTGSLIIQSAGRLQDLTTPRGPMILSGFTRDEEAAVLAAFPRLHPVDRSQEDEWVCVTLQKEAAFE